METIAYKISVPITDMETLAIYPLELVSPFALSLSDEQVQALMQTVAAALPVTQYGFRIGAHVATTTTVVTEDDHPYDPIIVPGQPG